MKKNKTNVFLEKLNYYLIAKKYLTVDNIESYRKKDLEKIQKRVEKNFLEKYLVSVALEWEQQNRTSTYHSLNKFKKISRRMKIRKNDDIRNRIYIMESRIFTNLRSLKTIEPPYDPVKNRLQEYAYFAYKNIKMFKQNKRIINMDVEGELFISKNEFVIWDNSSQKIMRIIRKKEVKEIILRQYTIEVVGKDFILYLSYHDLLIIFKSFERIWKRSITYTNNYKQTSNFPLKSEISLFYGT